MSLITFLKGSSPLGYILDDNVQPECSSKVKQSRDLPSVVASCMYCVLSIVIEPLQKQSILFSYNVRFFLVVHAGGFVKDGQVDLKLLRQLYW